MDHNMELAKVGYDAYGEQVGWRNYQGNLMPDWEDLGEAIQKAWAAAATAITESLIRDFDES